MKIIHYDKTGYMYYTDCPHGMKNKLKRYVHKVGTCGCGNCKYFYAKLILKDAIVCTHPVNANPHKQARLEYMEER